MDPGDLQIPLQMQVAGGTGPSCTRRRLRLAAEESPMDYHVQVRSTAADYVERYGENAVEFVRQLYLMAHRDGDEEAARLTRDVAVAADELLAGRLAAGPV
jgi:hypothetical protein